MSPPRNAIVRAFEVVATDPVRPPTDARSARIRILVRPGDEAGGAVAIDEVDFAVTEPLEPAPPSPPTPAPTVAAVATPAPPAPSSSSTTEDGRPTTVPAAPAVALEGSATPALDAAGIAAQRWLRISELMPDPAQANRDAEYEWLEIVNLGPTEASTAGISIADNRASTPLPAITLQPGDVAVIAAPLAEVDTPWWVAILGNGLGNAGDTVALIAPDGAEVDRVVYGEAAASEGVPVTTAPGAGRSIERWFGPDGQPAGARTTSTPSPGLYVIPEGSIAPVRSDGAVEAEPLAVGGITSDGGAATTWVVLIALAAGLLGGAGAQRAAEIVRGHRREE